MGIKRLSLNKLLAFFLFIISSQLSIAQANYPYLEIRLDKPSDFKDAEPFAANASSYLLSNPFKQKDPEREKAFNFLIRWTSGNPDYNFSMQGIIREMMDERDLMALFLAAMTKFCLENNALSTNGRLIETNAVKTVLDYCNNSSNNFSLKKRLRRRLEGN